MRKITLTLAVAALAMAGGAYASQDGPGKGPATRAEAEAHIDEMFDHLDANHDGVLDPKDREARAAERFAEIDTDGNGSISKTEFLSARPDGPGGPRKMGEKMGGKGWGGPHEFTGGPGGPGGPGMMGMHGPDGPGPEGMHGPGGPGMMLDMADKNDDGAVSKDEFKTAALTHFDKMDADGNGKVSKDERKAAKQSMKAQFKAFKAKQNSGDE